MVIRVYLGLEFRDGIVVRGRDRNFPGRVRLHLPLQYTVL